MKRMARQATVCSQLVVLAVLTVSPARGEIRDISGWATATVVQYHQGEEVQRDFSQETVPLTTPVPPAVVRARLDRLASENDVTAAGQAVAVLDNPNLGVLGTPNDVGIDIGAFSDDPVSSWLVEGAVTERRLVVIGPNEVGGDFGRGARAEVESRVLVSGVMLITATNATMDLSGVEVRLEIAVTRSTHVEGALDQSPLNGLGSAQGQIPDEEHDILLEGTVVLAGGLDGLVEIEDPTGAFENVPLDVVDFFSIPRELPLVQAILFTGLELPYKYEIIVGEPFVLELSVRSQVLAAPDGTGAAAVFGLPQDILGSVFERVKRDDRGRRLAAMISEYVDTTGQAYLEPTKPAPVLPFFPLCGGVGFEAIGLMLTGFCLMFVRVGRRRKANHE